MQRALRLLSYLAMKRRPMKHDEGDDIRLDPEWNARDYCGIPVGWKHLQWKKKHERFVAALSPEERGLWNMRIPPGWIH